MTTDTRTLLLKLPILALVSILIATAAVSSCQSRSTEEPTESPPYDVKTYGDLESISPQKQVIVLWYPYSQGQEEILLKLVDEFNTHNEWGITLIAEYAGPADTIYHKIRARTGSDALPAIVVADQHQAATYAMQGDLIALDPYVDSEKWGYKDEELNDFFPSALAADHLPQLEGRYDWPLHGSIEVFYYNEDWLADLGYTGPPATWEEFGEMACAASDPDAGTYGYEFSVDASTFANMLYNQDGQMIGDDAAAYTFGSDEALGVLTFIQQLLNDGCATLKTKGLGDQAGFGAGKVLFTVNSISRLPHYRRAVADGAGFDWSISTPPTSLDTPRVNVYWPGLSVLKTTPEKQLAAWLFLMWYTEPEQQARWASAFSYFPVRISAVGLLQDYLAENPRYEKALGFLNYDAAFEPGVAGYGECRAAIEKMLTAAAAFEDPATWLASTVEECNATLEE